MLTRIIVLCSILVCGFAASAQSTDLTLDGTVSYDISGSSVTLYADSISNNSSFNSGSMSWTLWATDDRYDGGTISGYILGEYFFDDILQAGFFYNQPSVTVSFSAPPDGTYYLTMTLGEWNGSEYITVDYVTFTNTESWGTSNDDPELVGGFPNAASLGSSWYYTELLGSYFYDGSGWFYSSWLGSFYANYTTLDSIWIYAPGVEWCYISPASTSNDQFWTYLIDYSTWCLTNEELFPSAFLNGIGWTVYDESVGDFYNLETGTFVNDSGGSTGGGANSVDYIITNTGGLDQASWNQFVETAASSIGSGNGYTQVEYTSTRFILRFTSDDPSLVQAVREGWEGLVGDYGGIRVDVE